MRRRLSSRRNIGCSFTDGKVSTTCWQWEGNGASGLTKRYPNQALRVFNALSLTVEITTVMPTG